MLEDPDAAVARAREAGVTRILTVGTGPASWSRALELAGRDAGVRAILGLHPHNAGDAHTGLDRLPELLDDDRVVAVGETGLDFFRDYAPRDAQRSAFEAQLDIAAAADMPVVIHSRAADEDTARTLERFGGTVVLH